ncbi:MAG: hypothetical protein HRT73_02400 [Flavobacteriales bacterium]|nr:hypothetical protein [Flavobacteriales bacterium]
MKKIILSIITIITISFSVNAQVEDHAIGVRLGGGNNGSGFEASYQHGLSDINRLEVDLGWGSKNSVSVMSVAATYQWLFQLEGALNWYAGPGAQFLLASKFGSTATAIGVGGQLGVEYNFNENDVPLLLSLDTRPMIQFGDNFFDGFGLGISLGVRYNF